MGALYIFIILLCRIVQHLFNKKSSNNINSIGMFLKYGGFMQLLSAMFALILIIITGNGVKINGLTVLISAFSGIMLSCSSMCSVFAMKTGTISLCTMFGTAGLLVPCVAGIILFDSPMSIGQWIGVALFFVAAYLLILTTKKTQNNFSFKTIFLLIGIMLANGFTMFAQQLFTKYVPNGDVSVFSFLSFGIVGVLMTALTPVIAKIQHEGKIKLNKNLVIYGTALAFAVFVINQLATLSTTIVPPAVLFTFINGGSTILAAIIGVVVFKEKLTWKNALGIVLGIVALVIIKIFE